MMKKSFAKKNKKRDTSRDHRNLDWQSFLATAVGTGASVCVGSYISFKRASLTSESNVCFGKENLLWISSPSWSQRLHDQDDNQEIDRYKGRERAWRVITKIAHWNHYNNGECNEDIQQQLPRTPLFSWPSRKLEKNVAQQHSIRFTSTVICLKPVVLKAKSWVLPFACSLDLSCFGVAVIRRRCCCCCRRQLTNYIIILNLIKPRHYFSLNLEIEVRP